MNKTKIEWVKNPDGSQGYTWNPITGCLNHVNGLCKGGGFPCYAYKLAHGRLRQRYLENKNYAPVINACQAQGGQPVGIPQLNPFYPRFWPERLSAPYSVVRPNSKGLVYYAQKPKGIFVCDMGELFGDWIPFQWQAHTFQTIHDNPQHRFYLLTKQPQNLIRWSPFPDNCWVGVTATNGHFFVEAMDALYHVEAKVKFLSLEPLLDWHIGQEILDGDLAAQQLDWLIIGACTGNLPDMTLLCERYPELMLARDGNKITAQPKIEWVEEIVSAADQAGVKVFLKDNLRPLFEWPNHEWAWHPYSNLLRQEMPIAL